MDEKTRVEIRREFAKVFPDKPFGTYRRYARDRHRLMEPDGSTWNKLRKTIIRLMPFGNVNIVAISTEENGIHDTIELRFRPNESKTGIEYNKLFLRELGLHAER